MSKSDREKLDEIYAFARAVKVLAWVCETFIAILIVLRIYVAITGSGL